MYLDRFSKVQVIPTSVGFSGIDDILVIFLHRLRCPVLFSAAHKGVNLSTLEYCVVICSRETKSLL